MPYSTIEKRRKHFKLNKDLINKYRRDYYRKNKEKIEKQNKDYRLRNKKIVAERRRAYSIKNSEKISKYKKDYYLKNKKKIDIYFKKYSNNKRITDIQFYLKMLLRTRVNNFARGIGGKRGSAIRDLGCTLEQLKNHLESKFKKGMNWNNRGKWHIDHIMPLSKFRLSNRKHFLQACHYTNLQPLWAKENRIKSNI